MNYKSKILTKVNNAFKTSPCIMIGMIVADDLTGGEQTYFINGEPENLRVISFRKVVYDLCSCGRVNRRILETKDKYYSPCQCSAAHGIKWEQKEVVK
jgi:hypothetical protein